MFQFVLFQAMKNASLISGSALGSGEANRNFTRGLNTKKKNKILFY
jgi:hypothetical protein